MSRMFSGAIALCLTIVMTGCKASPETPSAAVAKGGMMPIRESAPEYIYVVDQAEVKLVPERSFSTEPLSTFRAKLEEKRAADSKMTAGGESESATNAPASSEPKEKSMWGSLVNVLGGKKAKAASDETTSSDSPDDKGDDADDEQSGADDDSDDDW